MGVTDKEHSTKTSKKPKPKAKRKSTTGSKINKWINAQLEAKGLSVSAAKKDAGKYKTISAAKKAGSLYYTNPQGTVMIAAFASDLDKMPTKKKEKTPRPKTDEAKLSRKSSYKGSTDLGKQEAKRQAGSFKAQAAALANKAKKEVIKKKTDTIKGVNPVGSITTWFAAGMPKSGSEQASIKRKKEAEALKNIQSLTKELEKHLSSKDMKLLNKIINMNISNVAKEMQIKRLKSKAMNVGGMTSSMIHTNQRKVNPTTGLAMKKGGMVDYRKTGMFYGGGMSKRGR